MPVDFTPAEQPQQPSIDFQEIPAMPDTSGVQKMAQENLSANDNQQTDGKPQTPMDRLNTAAGMPVEKIIEGRAAPSDINTANRAQYVKALDNGSAVNSSDWMQTMLRSIPPIAAGAKRFLENVGEQETEFAKDTFNPENAPTNMNAEQYKEWFNKQPKQGYLSQLGADTSIFTGAAMAPVSGIFSTLGATGQEVAKQAYEPEEWESMSDEERQKILNVGTAGGQAVAGVATALAPLAHPPGIEPIVNATAKKLGIEPAAVTPEHVDTVIAQGAHNLHPAGEDFKSVSTVTGIPEQGLKQVYTETGVKPDQVFSDAQRNPSIASDVAAGKVPEQYEHLIEQKPVLPEPKAEALHVVRDEDTRSFRVVDKEGDHVQGGFDSYEDAQHLIADEKWKAEEAKLEAIVKGEKPLTERTELDVAGKQGEQLAAANEGRLKPSVAQQAPSEGLFDVAGRTQGALFDQAIKESEAPTAEKIGAPNVIPPAETGRITTLKQFLKNNGAKFDENNNIVSMKDENGQVRPSDLGKDRATELAHQYGYTPARLSIPELENLVRENPNHNRMADEGRVLQAKEAALEKQWKDPSFLEDQAYKAGIEADRKEGETNKQYVSRITKSLTEFYRDIEGSAEPGVYRKMLGSVINTAEKYAGKLTGDLFQQVADGYIKTFQPELAGPLAKRADAYMAKYKASLQEAHNSYLRQAEADIRRFDKLGEEKQKEWLYDHETGRWNKIDNPDHAQTEAMYDALHEAEIKAGVGTDAYKENYLPHQYEKPKEVEAFFRSEAMIKKYGNGWFNKASVFKLVQEADRAGFKLRTYNPARMQIARQNASYNMIATMDLLNDLKKSGVATHVSDFGIEKRIARTQDMLNEIETKYKKAFEKMNDPNQPLLMSELPPAESKLMQSADARRIDLRTRLDALTKQKSENTLTPQQMAELKTGFRIIGPDSKAWNIHQQAGALWKNAMEAKGLYENRGLANKFYEPYMAAKAIYVRSKMLASMWHPTHEVVIDISSDTASAAHHLIQGGKISDLATKEMLPNIGLHKEYAKIQEHPDLKAWNTPKESRTPEQQSRVDAMLEGGLVPSIPRQDAVKFRENFDKAINGIGVNNLRLIGTALEIPGLPMAPLMEHWIPGMKADSYFQRRNLALSRDPSLLQNTAKRIEVMRSIVQDIERNYGEMNRNTLFWDPVVRDSFNAATFSGGWKLAMLQNFRGLAEPAKIAYNWAKTGEFSKADITHQMLQSYIYTANMLMLGAGLNYLFTGAVGTLKDWINPQTGDKNPDGTPIRLRQPAFFNEPLMLVHDINQDGPIAGTGMFFYHQTQIPAINDTLLSRDFVGRPYITDPTDLQQWKNMGWDSISPITITSAERAEAKGSKIAQHMAWLGFPMAGSWVNQSPFEQKVIAAYDKLHTPTGNAYEAKLKAEMKGAVQNKDTSTESALAEKMKSEGMTSEEIANSKKPFKTPFAEFAWTKLSVQEQKRLIDSASEEEKKKFKIKSRD